MKGKWLILISLALLLAGIKTGWVVYEGYKKGQEEYRDVRQKYFLTEAEFEPDAGQEGNKKRKIQNRRNAGRKMPRIRSPWTGKD